MDILTEPDVVSPRPVAHPGAWLVGADHADRGAEYGAPSLVGAAVTFTPQAAPNRAGDAGRDIPPPSLGDIIGPRAAIGMMTP